MPDCLMPSIFLCAPELIDADDVKQLKHVEINVLQNDADGLGVGLTGLIGARSS